MIKFLKSLFAKHAEEQEPAPTPIEPNRDFGFIDYDGMGNQGRFPVDKNKKGVRR